MMTKKVIEGYIARTGPKEILFSNQPMRQHGEYIDGAWYPGIETEEDSPLDFEVDIHEYMDIPELTEEDSPRHCTVTIEVGEPAGKPVDAEYMRKRGVIRRNCAALAAETGRTFEETREILAKMMPEAAKYLED